MLIRKAHTNSNFTVVAHKHNHQSDIRYRDKNLYIVRCKNLHTKHAAGWKDIADKSKLLRYELIQSQTLDVIAFSMFRIFC